MNSAIVKEARSTTRLRSIRVLVSPTPLSFAERRSVLQVLQQEGPIEHFKMVPDYHANFISLTRNKATADALINRSPITYRLRTSNSNSNQLSKPIKKSALSTGDQDSSEEVSTAIEASADPSQGERTEFTLNIWPAEDYEHLQGATGSALHDGWSTTYLTDRSFAVEALKQALPNTIAAEGLAYWPQDMPKMQKDRKKERLEMKQWLPFGMASPGKKRNAGSNRTQRDPDLGPD